MPYFFTVRHRFSLHFTALFCFSLSFNRLCTGFAAGRRLWRPLRHGLRHVNYQSSPQGEDVGAAASAVRFGNRLVLPVSQHLAGQKGIPADRRE